MSTCIFCQKFCGNVGGLTAHQPYCKLNPNRKQRPKSPNAHKRKGSTGWSKGLTKETDTRIRARPELVGKKFGASLNGHKEETKKRLSVVAKGRNLGGYKKGSGRGKKGWYQGFFCDSSWELAFVIYCLEHQIPLERNTEMRQYVWQDKVRNYLPDFVVDGVTTEVKGYKTAQWLAKMEFNPDVRVLYQNDMKPILDYVISKYGKNFVELYQKV